VTDADIQEKTVRTSTELQHVALVPKIASFAESLAAENAIDAWKDSLRIAMENARSVQRIAKSVNEMY
jgi:hypothetical protein